MEIISEKPVPLAHVKATVSKIKKRDEEPNFRVTRMDDYLNGLGLLTQTKTNELIKKIESLEIPRLKEQHIFKIVDVLPRTPEDLKVILQGYTITVSNDNVKKIVDAVNDVA